jgi:hypothetical protein
MQKKAGIITNNQKGQTMLIVVLAIVIALTVGLSVASRSITNLKTTTEDINSQKALSAAEAGIEKALQKLTATSSPITGTFDVGKTSFSTTVSPVSGTDMILNGGNLVGKDQGLDLWLIDHNQDGTPNYSMSWPKDGSTGTISIYWGQTDDTCSGDSTNTMAALEIIVISGSQSSPTLERYTVDPCSSRADVNLLNKPDDKPIDPGGKVNEKFFSYSRINISIVNGLVARIVPLYASTTIAVVANPGLPSQGSIVNSVGKSGSTERKVSVFQGYPSLPVEYFPNNFFYHNL